MVVEADAATLATMTCRKWRRWRCAALSIPTRLKIQGFGRKVRTGVCKEQNQFRSLKSLSAIYA
jgi:hypothetical protein